MGLMAFVSLWAAAQERAPVLSKIAIVEQVMVPKTVCTHRPVQVPGRTSGAGAVMGAIAGGAIGNQIGGGSGNALATIIGVVGGAALGDKIEGPSPERIQMEQHCTTQNTYEGRVVGYNVVYEYAGRQYSTRMNQDPGSSIQIEVVPSHSRPAVQPSTYVQPVQPSGVYVTPHSSWTPEAHGVWQNTYPSQYSQSSYGPSVGPVAATVIGVAVAAPIIYGVSQNAWRNTYHPTASYRRHHHWR